MAGTLELYEELKGKLGEKEAKDLLEYVQQSVEKGAATKEDLLRLQASVKEDLQRFQVTIEKEIGVLKEGQHKLEVKVETIRAELLRWFFGSWATLMATILLKEFLK